MAVIGYHLQIAWFSGGFVGVDVFFVISGYLIGAFILDEVRQGTFSLAGFYARRIRRIVPAFAAMVFAVMVLSYFWLFPAEYVRLAWQAFYAAVSASNIYFLHHTGYFDAPASTQLLHTWSLGVEEQFYLAFPLLVIGIASVAPKHLYLGLGLLWAASFLASMYGVATYPQASFFLAPTRAWELLSGTLLAGQSWTAGWSRMPRELMAALGLALIGFAVVAYTQETSFPGAAALVPCAGAAMIIAAGQSGGSMAASLLSWRPFVFIGLISYSLYLWHWPIIIFQRADAAVLSTTSRLLILLYSVIVATLSWRFIERPFRVRFRPSHEPQVLAGGLLALSAVACAAILVVAAGGLPARFSPVARAYASYLDYGQAHFREGTCFIDPPYGFADFDRGKCLPFKTGRKNFLLIGDSHAAQLWYGLSKLMTGTNILQATAAGCSPDVQDAWRAGRSCGLLMDYMFSDYLPSHHVDRLLVAARWFPRDLPGLETMLAWARDRGIPVTLLGPMVEYDAALPRILAAAAESHDLAAAHTHQTRNQTELDGKLRAVAAAYGASYVSFYALLCGLQPCLDVAPDGSPLEFDTDHLTREGSLFVARRLLASGQFH
jgi:peptidoglycan/LPS O-acetylase OafA/YrhL